MPDTESFRMSVLHIDNNTDLPLLYAYRQDQNVFRTIGYVRLGGITLPWASHAGRDTAEERDRFLLKVLTDLLVEPAKAQHIVRTADHVLGTGGRTAGLPSAGDREPSGVSREERDGLHLAGPGLILGLLSGLVVGWLLAGWNGAVIGAFVGASTFPDLAVALWQLVYTRSARNYVEIHDTLALLMVTIGTITGGVLGYLLGSDGFGQACGAFLGMALAAFVLGLLATTFSMVPFQLRLMIWLGPLIVGAFAWGAHLLWSSPVSLAMGVVLGSVAARVLARRVRNATW